MASFSRFNPNPKALADLLVMISQQPTREEAARNTVSNNVALSRPIDIVADGEIAVVQRPLIDKAWQQMFINAAKASSAAECERIIEDWKDTLKQLKYDDWVVERVEAARNL